MARFRVGNENWELCSGRDSEGCEPVRRLLNYDSAMAWLHRYKANPSTMMELRHICTRLDLGPVHHLDDHEVLEHIAWAIHHGRLRACMGRIREHRGAGGGATAGTRKEPVAASPQAKKTQKTWVEFAVVDMEGNPVSNKRFLAMLPDGSLQEGMLSPTGIVRFNNIDPENSVFSLPELDKEAWERVN